MRPLAISFTSLRMIFSADGSQPFSKSSSERANSSSSSGCSSAERGLLQHHMIAPTATTSDNMMTTDPATIAAVEKPKTLCLGRTFPANVMSRPSLSDPLVYLTRALGDVVVDVEIVVQPVVTGVEALLIHRDVGSPPVPKRNKCLVVLNR